MNFQFKKYYTKHFLFNEYCIPNVSLKPKNREIWVFMGNRNMSKKEESEYVLESLNCTFLE